MKTLIIFIALTSSAFALDVLSRAEQHRLGAYLSYIVSSLEDSEQEEVYKAGDTCPSCGGRGKQGDGVVCSTCNFSTPDGLLSCKGTGKLQPSGQANDSELAETFAEEQAEEMFEILEESGGFPDTPDITEIDSNLWNWEGRSNASVPTEFMRKHLREAHGLGPEVENMSRIELQSLHNIIHDAEVRASEPVSSSSSCPTCPSGGSCPTCPSSGSCPTCPSSGSSRSSSSSRSRGLFGRRR